MSIEFNAALQSLYAKKYTLNFELQLQQSQSKLESCVSIGETFAAGAEKVQEIVRYGETQMNPVLGTNDNIEYSNLDHEQRWVRGSLFDNALLLNGFTQLDFMQQSPEMAIVMAQKAAAMRKKDQVILNSFFANALTGTDGTQTKAFDSNNVIPVTEGAGAATGLNIKKLEAVKELAVYNEVNLDEEMLYAVITEKQQRDLGQQIEAKNADYTAQYAVKRNMNGDIQSVLGIEFKVFSSATLAKFGGDAQLLDGSSYRRIPVFSKKGMSLSTWRAEQASIDKIVSKKGHPLQFYIMMNIGSSRTDEKRVFEIKCAES